MRGDASDCLRYPQGNPPFSQHSGVYAYTSPTIEHALLHLASLSLNEGKRSEDRDHDLCIPCELFHRCPCLADADAHTPETPCRRQAWRRSDRHRYLVNSVAVAWSASRGKEPIHWRHGTNVDPRDVPPHWEGLDASEELRPDQEPGPRGKTRGGAMFRGEIGTPMLHE
jgi:hypothetical protein